MCWLGVEARWGESAFLVNSYFPIEFEPGHGDFRLKLVLEAKPWLAGRLGVQVKPYLFFVYLPSIKLVCVEVSGSWCAGRCAPSSGAG